MNPYPQTTPQTDETIAITSDPVKGVSGEGDGSAQAISHSPFCARAEPKATMPAQEDRPADPLRPRAVRQGRPGNSALLHLRGWTIVAHSSSPRTSGPELDSAKACGQFGWMEELHVFVSLSLVVQ